MRKHPWIQFSLVIILIFGAFAGCQSVNRQDKFATSLSYQECSTPALFTECMRNLDLGPAWAQFSDGLKVRIPIAQFADDLLRLNEECGPYVTYDDMEKSIVNNEIRYCRSEWYERHKVITCIQYNAKHEISDLRFWYEDNPKIIPAPQLDEPEISDENDDGAAFLANLIVDILEAFWDKANPE